MLSRSILVAALAAGIAAFANAGHAAMNQTSPSGLGFSCDVNTKRCRCGGVWEGADCEAMKKNCERGADSSYGCVEGANGYCECTMGRMAAPPKFRVPRAPIGETKTLQRN